MQTVYNALNDIDAQLAVDRLKAAGIDAQVFGSFLSSASGELPANSMVRVQVADEDAATARELVAEWQRELADTETAGPQLVDDTPPPVVPQRSLSGSGIGMLVAGMLIGAFAAFALLRLPPSQSVIDYNSDGLADITFVYAGETLSSVDYDRNADGEVDFRTKERDDGHGTQLDDADFDGRFESRVELRKGWMAINEVDRDGDGFSEIKEVYKLGNLDQRMFLAPPSGDVIKREYYALGLRTHSEADLDRDGTYETKWTFDEIEEPRKAD